MTTNSPASATSSTRRRARYRAPSASRPGPVSADAVLLTSMGTESGQADGLPHALISQVVSELVRRGVRALEAFGRTAETAELLDADAVVPRAAARHRGAGGLFVRTVHDPCRLPARRGFHRRRAAPLLPRLRLELDKGLGWKAEVEAALKQLLDSAQLQQPVGAGAEVRS